MEIFQYEVQAEQIGQFDKKWFRMRFRHIQITSS